MTIRTTVRLSENLLAAAKRKAAKEGRTLTSLIEDGLRAVLLPTTKTKKRRRVLIPVSKATGGPVPGVDYRSYSALEEMDDLEYFGRMNRGSK